MTKTTVPSKIFVCNKICGIKSSNKLFMKFAKLTTQN